MGSITEESHTHFNTFHIQNAKLVLKAADVFEGGSFSSEKPPALVSEARNPPDLSASALLICPTDRAAICNLMGFSTRGVCFQRLFLQKPEAPPAPARTRAPLSHLSATTQIKIKLLK